MLQKRNKIWLYHQDANIFWRDVNVDIDCLCLYNYTEFVNSTNIKLREKNTN